MPKKFEFDAQNNLTVKEAVLLLEPHTVWNISPYQIEKHKPMFDADMTAPEKTKTLSIAALFKI